MPETIDIGLLEYPGAQEAALFGLTDLFEIANHPDRPRLKVTRWRAGHKHLVPTNESRAPSTKKLGHRTFRNKLMVKAQVKTFPLPVDFSVRTKLAVSRQAVESGNHRPS